MAILNDDDEWFAEKLERQLAVAAESQFAFPVIATRVIGRSEHGDLCWPRRFPEPSEPVSEYIFCQRDLMAGEGLILPSATLTSRELLNRVPFREGLRRHVDADWLLRVAQVPGVGVEFVPSMAPLVIWNIDEKHLRMSHSTDWRFSLDWARERRELMTRRAYGAFVLTRVGTTAARAREYRAFFVLLREAFRLGQPNSAELIAYLILWFLPPEFRRRITLFFERTKRHQVLRQPGP
ncbi:MAG: glycosyltransferase family 2 protein [Candidatus Binatia bacterium]